MARSSEGGLTAGKTCERRRRVAVDVAREQGRWESGALAAPQEHGPAGEEGKWARPRENSTLLNFFEYFRKDLN
jgi:hypothetical protein